MAAVGARILIILIRGGRSGSQLHEPGRGRRAWERAVVAVASPRHHRHCCCLAANRRRRRYKAAVEISNSGGGATATAGALAAAVAVGGREDGGETVRSQPIVAAETADVWAVLIGGRLMAGEGRLMAGDGRRVLAEVPEAGGQEGLH